MTGNQRHYYTALLATFVCFWLSCCAEPNSAILQVRLIEGDTYTRADTVSGEELRLLFDADEGSLVRFRAWTVGVLAGVEVTVRDERGEVVFTETGVGTEFRIDGLEIATSGTHEITLQWLEGGGVSAYRFETIGSATEKLIVQPRLSLEQPLAGHQAIRLPDGRILITGGHTAGSGMSAGAITPLATTSILNPVTGEVTPGQQMLDARAYHAAAIFPGGTYEGKVLIAGGLGASGDALFTTELFDPESGEFSRGPELPEPRAYLEALPISVPAGAESLFLDNNIVLAFGERTRRGPQHSFSDGLYSEVDENRREIWRTDGEVVQRISNGDASALLEVGRLQGKMVFLPTSQTIMFIGGGVDTIPTQPGCNQDLENVCHCTSASIPLCTEFRDCSDGLCATVRSYTRKDLATDIVEIHRDGKRTTLVGNGLNRPRAAFGVAQLSGDRILIAGGVSAVRRGFWGSEAQLFEAPDTIDSVEMWVPSDIDAGTGSWKVLPPLSIPREHFDLVPMSDGAVYAFGGLTPVAGGVRPVNLIERYDDDIFKFVPIGNLASGRIAPEVVAVEDSRQVWLLGGETEDAPSATVENVSLLAP